VYQNVAYIVVVAPIGDLTLSWLSDRALGRKNMYIVTMSLYGASSAIIAADLLLLKPGPA
jgi:MFS family permease